ncbi:MAG TPA: response regulator transcription factor [Anaerolineaceae bacterium]|nr:response regulator transcription factor [Anaerolineaceae bacterium]
MEETHILIVEDEPSVARGIQAGLKKEGFLTTWASSGRQALESASSERPHLILLDLRLPDISGFDVCRSLRAGGYLGPVVMVTARDEEVDRVLGLELGADDYIVKPFSLRELISRIRAQLRRSYGAYARDASRESLRFGDVELDLVRFAVCRSGKPVNLTPVEFRLLVHLAGHPGRAFRREDLVAAVWGYDSEILNDRTIDVHIHHLREKLEADPENPRWLRTVRGVGYCFEP